MKGSRLLDLMESLDKKELKTMQKVVESPFFNQNEHVINLFYYLADFAPDFTEEELSKHECFSALFPTEKFSDKKLRNVMSDLKGVIERFLMHEALRKNENYYFETLLAQLDQRRIDKQYESNYTKYKKKVNAISKQNSERYRLQHRLAELHYSFCSRTGKKEINETLEEVVTNLDLYFIIKKLSYSCENINRQNIYDNDYQFQFLDELIEAVEASSYAEHPVIQIYLQIIKMLIDFDDNNHFYNLRDLLRKHYLLFTKEENKQMYSYALNYCVKKINSGDNSFARELFELYQQLVVTEVMFVDNVFLAQDFKNICTVGLKLEEYHWVDSFITNYSNKLHPNERENAVAFNKANLAFAREEFSEAIVLLQKVEFTNVYYALDSRTVLLKCYYELNETSALESLIASFKVYIKRNDYIPRHRAIAYNNILKFVGRLYRSKQREQVPDAAILADMNNSEFVAYYSWVKEKYFELKDLFGKTD